MGYTKFITIIAVLILSVQAFSQNKVSKVNNVTEASIKKDVEKVVCENDKRIESVKKLFLEKGASEENIETKKYKSVTNLIITKKGSSDEIVVVGAHYDKTNSGCGAIDNWTGIVILANLYQQIRTFNTKKTYIFVAFGREEDGLIGSKAMVKKIPKENRTNYCAMINFDSFGFAYTQAARNLSDKSLMNLTKEVLEGLKIPFSNSPINGSSDSLSFKSKDIPAITLHGLDNNWIKYLHTNEDKLKNIKPLSVYIAYVVGLRMIAKIDALGCQTFRGKYEVVENK